MADKSSTKTPLNSAPDRPLRERSALISRFVSTGDAAPVERRRVAAKGIDDLPKL